MRIVYFDVAAIIILLVMGFSYFGNKILPLHAIKIQGYLLIAIFYSTVLDLLSCEFGNHPGLVPHWVMFWISFGYFIFRSAIAFVFFWYIYVATFEEKRWKKICRNYVWGLCIALYIGFIVNIFVPFMFYVDEAGCYHRQSGIFVIYAIAATCSVLAFINILKDQKHLNRNERRSLCIFCVLPLASVIVQFFFPSLLVEGCGISLCFVLMCLEIQKPDQLMDHHTGIMNGRAFEQEVVYKLQRKSEFGLLLVFSSNYEFIEELIGAQSAEKFIAKIAQEVKKLTKSRKVFYLGAGKFAVLFRLAEENEIVETTKKGIVQAVKRWEFGDLKMDLPVNACFLRAPEEIHCLDDVYCYIEYLATMHLEDGSILLADELDIKDARRVRSVESAVERAVHEHGFQVFLQPIYNVKEKLFTSAEALIRLQDPDIGVISPDELIPIAERTGQIIAMGRQVLESVCQFIAQNNLEKMGIEYIEVNLSVMECIHAELVNEMNFLTQKYGIRLDQINLEITETATVGNSQMLSSNMDSLFRQGMSFSLDDYGRGYSNISYMMELPFRIVKIDKSILWFSSQNEKAAIALKSMIGMIRKMGMKILVEGVETPEMAGEMERLGCDYLQGYYYSKPLSMPEFLKTLS